MDVLAVILLIKPQQKTLKHCLCWLVALLLSLSLIQPAKALASEREDSLKAALLFKLSKFVEWPKSQQPHFTICSDAQGNLAKAIRALTKYKIHDQPVQVNLLQGNSNELLDRCHILFITQPDPDQIKAHLMSVYHHQVLTISDIKNFSKFGGMIELSKNQQRFHFLINLKAVKDSPLKIASPLLELATIVSE